MVIFAAEGCGVIFKSDLQKRDTLARRRGQLSVQPRPSPRYFSAFAGPHNPYLDTFMCKPPTPANVRISSLRTVQSAKSGSRHGSKIDEDIGLNFTKSLKPMNRFQDAEEYSGISSLSSRSRTKPRGSISERCWTATAAVPRGAQAADRREIAFVANMNSLVRPYKEQCAAAFFAGHGTQIAHAQHGAWPAARGRMYPEAANRKLSAPGRSNMEEGGCSVQLPSRPFEECPEAWHVYAVQCFLTGDQVLLHATLPPLSPVHSASSPATAFTRRHSFLSSGASHRPLPTLPPTASPPRAIGRPPSVSRVECGVV